MPSFVGVNEVRGRGGAANLLIGADEGRRSEAPLLSGFDDALDRMTPRLTVRLI